MLNYIKIAILPLLFLFGEDTLKSIAWFSMVFSDAQPVQFWPVECDTYNQHIHDGVFHRCFCQPWACDDQIKIQFQETLGASPETGGDYHLSIRSEEGEDILTIPFTKSGLLELQALADATNYDIGETDWMLGAAPTLFTSGDSNILKMDLSGAVEDTDYTFHYDLTKSSGVFTNADVLIAMYDEDGNVLDSLTIHVTNATSNSIVGNVIFNAGLTTPAFLGISFVTTISNVTITVNEFDLTTEDVQPIFYNLSFIPEETSPEICEQRVQFFIVNTDTDEDVAKSDCQSITDSKKNTILLSYTNDENVFGISYENQTPEFNLRIPATFFHQRFPGEDEVMELSYLLLTLNSTLRRQRLLETDYLPYYFHEKIILALQHQYVTIIDKSWVKQDGYEIAEGNRMYPEKRAKVWLGEKEFVQRNVL